MYKVNDSLVEKAQKKERGNKNFGLFLGIICLLMVTIFIFSNFILLSVYVDGRSMDPTLKSGEVIFANKNLTAQVGDIVVIDGEKVNAKGTGYDLLIKRAVVFGQKGKTIVVEIKNGKIWSGEKGKEMSQLTESYLPQGTQTMPTLPDNRTHWELEEDDIFYLGDNRAISKDSRSEYGTCKTNQVVGVVPDWAISARGVSKFIYDIGQFFDKCFS